MKHRPYRSALIALFCLVLFAWPVLVLPTAAQQPTPQPTPQPTLTTEELLGVADQVNWLQIAWDRFGWLILIAIVVIVGLLILRNYGQGILDAIREQGKKAGAKPFEQIEKRAAEEAKAQAIDAGTAAYLEWLQDELKHLPIIPIKSAERPTQLALQAVYVPLRVVERAQIEGFRKLTLGEFDPGGEYQLRVEAFEDLEHSQRVYRLLSDPDQLPAIDADDQPIRRLSRAGIELREHTTTRLLLVGDAGSGKTTTLHFGALVLAHDYANNNTDGAQDALDLYIARPLLPIYIRLTLVATYVRESSDRADAADLPRLHGAPSRLLLDWLDGYLHAQVGTKHPDLPFDLPSRQMANGNCLILLDGLDETGDAAQRDYMQRLITNLVQDYPANRYLVASRPFDDLWLPEFDERHLSPMNSDEMQLLLHNWFGAVHASDGASRRAQESVTDQVGYLWGILERNARLFEMATNPLLLTSMALLVQTGVGLPRERAELYNRLVYLLLETWRIQQIAGGVPGQRGARPLLYGGEESVSSVQRRLQEVAAWMQEQQRREIRLDEAQTLLRPTYTELMNWHAERCDDYVSRLFESLALESGLVQKRDRGYSFGHYTLQEYLTARAYDQHSDGVVELFAQREQPRWRETILLAVGHWATSGDPDKARQLLRQLLDTGAASAVLLAGAALSDADADRVPELAPLRVETITCLRALAFEPTRCPDPRTRNQAAELLDRLDADDRPEQDLAHPDYWAQRIEAGPFMMGPSLRRKIEREDNDLVMKEYEESAFLYSISHPYTLARFPVTNQQYFSFLEALEAQGKTEEAQERRPRRWPGRRYRAGAGNHPVADVSWEDASAFAQWANDTLLTEEQRARGEQIRLPTEPEWERAAAYPVIVPKSDPDAGKREYPWGEGLLDFPANIVESGIDNPSVVGIFPHGAAACGAEELAGNVCEWCSTPYLYYPLPEELSAESLYTQGYKDRMYVLPRSTWVRLFSALCVARECADPIFSYDLIGLRLARVFSCV